MAQRVFVFPEKTWEEFGEKRWAVEWHTVKPSALARIEAAIARGEDPDSADPDTEIDTNYRVYPYRAKARAIAYAKRMAKCERSAYGSAIITEEVVDWYVEEDRIAEWTTIGDPVYVP